MYSFLLNNLICSRKKSSKACLNETHPVNLARVVDKKPGSKFDVENQRKIWASSQLPFLLKQIHFLPPLHGNLSTKMKSSERPTMMEKKTGKRKKKWEKLVSFCFVCIKTL